VEPEPQISATRPKAFHRSFWQSCGQWISGAELSGQQGKGVGLLEADHKGKTVGFEGVYGKK